MQAAAPHRLATKTSKNIGPVTLHIQSVSCCSGFWLYFATSNTARHEATSPCSRLLPGRRAAVPGRRGRLAHHVGRQQVRHGRSVCIRVLLPCDQSRVFKRLNRLSNLIDLVDLGVWCFFSFSFFRNGNDHRPRDRSLPRPRSGLRHVPLPLIVWQATVAAAD